MSVSVLTLRAKSVERYLAICKPWRERLTTRRILTRILLIWVLYFISDDFSVGVRSYPDGHLSGALPRYLQTLARAADHAADSNLYTADLGHVPQRGGPRLGIL